MKPKSEAGKGDANRISDLEKFEKNYDKINFGIKIFYADNSYELAPWYYGEGYYFHTTTSRMMGPYNTWMKAKKESLNHKYEI